MVKRSYSGSMPLAKRRKLMSKITLRSLPKSILPETKYIDFQVFQDNTGFSSVSAIVINQGAGRAQRTGNKVFIKSLDISFASNPSALANYRITVLIPKDPSIAPVQLPPDSKYNQDDFWVLRDTLKSTQESTTHRMIVPINSTQTYGSTGLPLANRLYVVACSTNTAISGAVLTTRMYYTDA